MAIDPTKQSLDDRLAPHYGPFALDHDVLPEQFIQMVGTRRRRVPSRARRLHRPAAAAVVVLMAGAASVWYVLDDQVPAYGIDDLSQRMMWVRTIHVRGWDPSYEDPARGTDLEKVPFELFVGPPARYWLTRWRPSRSGRIWCSDISAICSWGASCVSTSKWVTNEWGR